MPNPQLHSTDGRQDRLNAWQQQPVLSTQQPHLKGKDVAAMKATHIPPILDLDTGMTPADLLRGAALYLRRHGRITGEFFDLLADTAFPPACALGAINICAHGRAVLSSDDGSQDADTDAAITAMRVFAAFLDTDYSLGTGDTSAIDIVSAFNDNPDTTDDHIINALTEAADDYDRTRTSGGAR